MVQNSSDGLKDSASDRGCYAIAESQQTLSAIYCTKYLILYASYLELRPRSSVAIIYDYFLFFFIILYL